MPAAENPYVGPRAFRQGERLPGRDREVLDLLDLMIAQRIVLLYSPSGAGKTSLIRAGLIPKLEEEEFSVLPVVRVSGEPSTEAAKMKGCNRYVLSVLLALDEGRPQKEQLPEEKLATMTLGEYLGESDQDQVLLFDQFEEILTVDPLNRDAKDEFFRQLGSALKSKGLWALFAMREDFVAGLDPYLPRVPTRLRTTSRLDLLGEKAARAAIQLPARRAEVEFSDDAAKRVADDLRRMRVQRSDGGVDEQLGPYVEPVQLQVVCHRLWSSLPVGTDEIRSRHVEALGNVDTALADYYAEKVGEVANGIGERGIREWIDRKLITDQGIRGQVLQGPEESEGLANDTIRALIDRHLVRAEKRRGAVWLELAHDRLIDPVRKDNARWREENLSPLQRRAALWDDQNRPAELLFTGADLETAETWVRDHDDVTAVEREFVAESRRAHDAVLEETRKRRRIRQLSAITLLLVAGLLFVAGFGYQNYLNLQNNKARRYFDLARHFKSTERYTSSLALLVQANIDARDDDLKARLEREQRYFRPQYGLQEISTGDDVSWTWYRRLVSNDGRRALSIAPGDPGTSILRLWELPGTSYVKEWTGKEVEKAVLSGNGETVAVLWKDGWDLWNARSLQRDADKEAPASLPDEIKRQIRNRNHSVRHFSVDFAGEQALLSIWNRRTREGVSSVRYDGDKWVLIPHANGFDGFNDAVFATTSGVIIASAGSGAWSIALDSDAPTVTALGFVNDQEERSPESPAVIQALRTVPNRKMVIARTHHEFFVRTTSDFLSAGGFEATDGAVLRGVRLSPNGRRLVSWDSRERATLWDLTGDGRVEHLQRVGYAEGARFSSDDEGSRIVTWEANVVRVYHAESGSQIGLELVHDSDVRNATFAADGATVWSATDGGGRVWTPLADASYSIPSNVTHPGSPGSDRATIEDEGFGSDAVLTDKKSGKSWNLDHVGLKHAVFCPQEEHCFATVGLNDVKVWDYGSGQQIGVTIRGTYFKEPAFSSDHDLLLTSRRSLFGRGNVHQLWEPETGFPVGIPLRSHSNRRAVFDAHGSIVAADEKGGWAWKLPARLRRSPEEYRTFIRAQTGVRFDLNDQFQLLAEDEWQNWKSLDDAREQ